jgi:thiol-disulfide isomerase/thioredoxin
MTARLSRLELPMALSAALLASALALAPGPAAAEKGVEAFAVHEAPKPVPELAFQRGDGSPATLNDFRGKVVLLNIWATWCVPCRREMPTLDRLQARLGGPGFEVVALSIDRAGVEVVRKFYGEIAIKNLPIYIDRAGKATRTLKVAGLPTTLLIDDAGGEIGRLVGPAEWDAPEMVSFLRRHIKEIRKLGSG